MDSEDDVETLRRRLAESEAGRKQAEDGLKQAEANQRRGQDRLREQTFDEVLQAYLDILPDPIVQQDRERGTKGTTTNPTGKKHPICLRRWTSFLSEQSRTMGLVRGAIPNAACDFESKEFIASTAAKVSSHVIGSERDLDLYLYNAVQSPVTQIIRVIQDKYADSAGDLGLRVGTKFNFENHFNTVGESQKRKPPVKAPRRPRIDQICVSVNESDSSLPATFLVAEHKAPHKIPAYYFRAGLQEMDLQDIINEKELPDKNDEQAVFESCARRLVASMVTQTFDYMVRCGLQYGYITTGEAYVFLKVDWRQPEVLYYHLAEPVFEAAEQPVATARYCSAISQVLAFCAQALQGEVTPQEQRKQVLDMLPEWIVDWNSVLEELESSSSEDLSSSSPYQEPVSYASFDRSPRVIMTRQRAKGCSAQGIPRAESSSRSPSPDSPSPTPARLLQKSRRAKRAASSPSQAPERKRTAGQQNEKYCTHECIRSLIIGAPVDRSCPNVDLHVPGTREGDADIHHPFDGPGLQEAIRNQQRRTLDQGCDPIIRCSGGVIFRVRLMTHGYTVLGKGTVETAGKLRREQKIYDRLSDLQGERIPVCLGAIEMPAAYLYMFYEIRHMLLLTWAGTVAKVERTVQDDFRDLLRERNVIRLRWEDDRFTNCPYTNRLVAVGLGKYMIWRKPQHIAVERLRRQRGERRGEVRGHSARHFSYQMRRLSHGHSAIRTPYLTGVA